MANFERPILGCIEVDFPTNIFLQNLALIQNRTSPTKFAHLADKSEIGSISKLPTKAPASPPASPPAAAAPPSPPAAAAPASPAGGAAPFSAAAYGVIWIDELNHLETFRSSFSAVSKSKFANVY